MAKPPTVAQTIAHRVRKYRQERGWSVRQLAEECAKRGATTLTQASLTNIERGLSSSSNRGSRAVSVEEMLTLAAVLEVPPIMMMLPIGEHNTVEICPGVVMEPRTVGDWFYGSNAARKWFGIEEPKDRYGSYERTAAVVGHVGWIHVARQEAHDIYRMLRMSDEDLRLVYRHGRDYLPMIGGEDIPEDEWVVEARAVMPEVYATRLRRYADRMWQAHDAGVRVPLVPKHLYDAIIELPTSPGQAAGAEPASPPVAVRPILPPGLEIEVAEDGDS